VLDCESCTVEESENDPESVNELDGDICKVDECENDLVCIKEIEVDRVMVCVLRRDCVSVTWGVVVDVTSADTVLDAEKLEEIEPPSVKVPVRVEKSIWRRT